MYENWKYYLIIKSHGETSYWFMIWEYVVTSDDQTTTFLIHININYYC